MELIVPLNVQGGRPLYEQIYQYIKDEIRKGNIRPEKQLPSSRELAKSLKVSRSTTQLAYEQLVSEGYLEAVPRKGYFAASLDGIFPPVAQSVAARPDQKKELSLGMEKESVRGQLFREKFEVDFSPRGIDLEGFPYATWRKISRSVLKEEDRELFLKGEPQGDLILREAIREYLHAARGVNCDVSQIIIGAGNEYLLMLLSTVIGQNHKVALENPTYKQAYRLFKSLSYDVCTVDMDEKGMKVADLKSSGADIAFVMPSHQYPLGIVMPMKRRMELLKWAAKDPARYIIEDDYDSEFRYKGKPIPALQGYDRWEKVIYIGTFSKSIAPSIRVSYMVLPAPLLKEFQKKSSFLSSTVSRVDQLILQKFIEDGHYERHLNRIRTLYKSRHDTLMGCLKTFQKICTISGENAGVHMLLHFAGDMTEEELIRKAAEKGVRVYGLSQYYIDPPDGLKPTIMLGYANISEDKMKEAVKLLEEAWK